MCCQSRKQPDRFVENEHLFSPQLDAKRAAWNGVLQYDSPASCKRFWRCDYDVKNVVAKAKEDWIQKTIQAANVNRDSYGQWQCVKELHDDAKTADTGTEPAVDTTQMKEADIVSTVDSAQVTDSDTIFTIKHEIATLSTLPR